MRGIKIVVAILLMLAVILSRPPMAEAAGCPNLRVVFARGSGGERWKDANYLAYKSALESKLATTDLTYEFIDLDYPAVGVGVDNLEVTLGALIGSGDAYEFGESVKSGVKKLDKMINSASCPETKYVVGGYSQGAMVVSKALFSLRADRLIYAATFGDPKLYLPEGKGLIPTACRGENLSDYRMYVPDCRAYKGLLGAYIPYEPTNLIGKVGTWCNKRDIFCSSHLNVTDHVSYISENLYEDASRVIFDKVCQTFDVVNTISSPHDTAILIDSSGSMTSMINAYKAEALRLATETLVSGGRVALYDYRDLNDPYDLVKHCDFESCSLETFSTELDSIRTSGGGDTAESLLSAAFHTMADLNWKYGSTKSLVVLTDANFLSPDRDGMTFDEVVAMSKQIDPVNFYIITKGSFGDDYAELARETDGRIVTNFDELNLLTDYIMERYDSLPRVEESSEEIMLPTLVVKSVNGAGTSEAIVDFTSSNGRVLVALNDRVMGVTNKSSIRLTGLDMTQDNALTLIPLGDDVRGEGVDIDLSKVLTLPKVPNTGKN